MTTPDPLLFDEDLQRGLARTHEHRRAEGIDVVTGRPTEEAMADRAALQRRAPDERLRWDDLPETMVGAMDQFMNPVIHYCGNKLDNGKLCRTQIPSYGICGPCTGDLARAERKEAIRLRIEAEIPEMFRDVTWKSLHRLRNELDDGPRVIAPPARFPNIRRGLETEPRSIIVGPSGAGKTTLAIAFLRAAIVEGIETARFVLAIDLDDTDEGRAIYYRALHAKVLVIDDVGAETHGAQPKSGLAAQRIKFVDNLVTHRFQRRLRTVITTGSPRWRIQQFYGPGIARRMFNGAAVVEVGEQIEVEPRGVDDDA